MKETQHAKDSYQHSPRLHPRTRSWQPCPYPALLVANAWRALHPRPVPSAIGEAIGCASPGFSCSGYHSAMHPHSSYNTVWPQLKCLWLRLHIIIRKFIDCPTNDTENMAASALQTAKKVPSCMFVCLGNICRSPTAEYVTRKLASDREMDIEVASSGTGNWHEGEGAHPPMVAAAKRKKYDLAPHVAQQVTAEHLKSYDYVLCMDSSNLSNLKRMFPA